MKGRTKKIELKEKMKVGKKNQSPLGLGRDVDCHFVKAGEKKLNQGITL
jgi:hypothetical protein